MLTILRHALVTVLATVLTIGPVSAAQWIGCGCETPPEPIHDSPCGCEVYVAPCSSCCEESTVETPTAETETADPIPAPKQDPEPQSVQRQPTEPQPSLLEESDPEPAVDPDASSTLPVQSPMEQSAVLEPDSVNDLFDTPSEADAPITPTETDPIVSPSTTEADELFLPVDDSAPVEDPDVEDPTILEPAGDEPAGDGPAIEEPADDAAEPVEEVDPLDDLFGQANRSAAQAATGGFPMSEFHTWTDNTAKFHCEARFLGVAQGKIVLAHADGRISRVPLRRLSSDDLSFVYQHVVAKREMLARQAEAEKLASAWSE
jgi:hypothetical protein